MSGHVYIKLIPSTTTTSTPSSLSLLLRGTYRCTTTNTTTSNDWNFAAKFFQPGKMVAYFLQFAFSTLVFFHRCVVYSLRYVSFTQGYSGDTMATCAFMHD